MIDNIDNKVVKILISQNKESYNINMMDFICQNNNVLSKQDINNIKNLSLDNTTKFGSKNDIVFVKRIN